MNQPILYILMRNDMASMNPGKAVAQGSHATSLFERDVRNPENSDVYEAWNEWRRQASGFGTTITLGVSGEEMFEAIDDLERGVSQYHDDSAHAPFIFNITHDPTYPITDGDVCHMIPLDTCVYVFGWKADVAKILSKFDLLP